MNRNALRVGKPPPSTKPPTGQTTPTGGNRNAVGKHPNGPDKPTDMRRTPDHVTANRVEQLAVGIAAGETTTQLAERVGLSGAYLDQRNRLPSSAHHLPGCGLDFG